MEPPPRQDVDLNKSLRLAGALAVGSLWFTPPPAGVDLRAWHLLATATPRSSTRLKQVAVSNDRGIKPLWSRDGRELFYLRLGTPFQLMAVLVDTGGATEPFAVWQRTSTSLTTSWAMGKTATCRSMASASW